MDEQFNRTLRLWCERCRRPTVELIYLDNGKHYCWDCAERQRQTFGFEAAGKRETDLDPWDREDEIVDHDRGTA